MGLTPSDFFTRDGDRPYRAVLPENSNGYVEVLTAGGSRIALCSGKYAARNAKVIECALNFASPPPAADAAEA